MKKKTESAYPMLRQSGWTISNYSSVENVGNLSLAIRDALVNFGVVTESTATGLAEKVIDLERSLKDISEKEKRYFYLY